MSMGNSCGCGCSTMTMVTKAAEPCACGCACCADTPHVREHEVAELKAVRDSAARRLAELGET